MFHPRIEYSQVGHTCQALQGLPTMAAGFIKHLVGVHTSSTRQKQLQVGKGGLQAGTCVCTLQYSLLAQAHNRLC